MDNIGAEIDEEFAGLLSEAVFTPIGKQAYLDRVALEAMKKALSRDAWYEGDVADDQLADDCYQLARAMLKARSRGGAV